ncbi:glycoside hydrolase family protein [Caballeronia terrestris]|uniref:Serine protease n=1 Tax=Caballeronia terrestris TaxID=1226301 RepID=A0A158I197_9BURK|nr:trypsin-like serine protease [Caballeronia terrestris]SAL49780.1 glycoside hydrolase family protein [Caballeronia terrestris]
MLSVKLTVVVLLSALSSTLRAADQDWQKFVTAEKIAKVSSRADPQLVAVLVGHLDLLKAADINSRTRALQFLTQVFTETNGLRRIDENLMYTAPQLVAVFGDRLTPQIATQIAGDEKKTANYVYGDHLGNKGRDTNDGWDYRGSGYLQMTGRYNFRMRGKETQLQLEKRPDIARQPFEGLNTSLSYWTSNNISAIADTNDLRKVRIAINGNRALGLEQSKLWYGYLNRMFGGAAAEGALISPSESVQTAPREAAGILRQLGYLSPALESSSNVNAIGDALKAFQNSKALPTTGVLDENTLYALTDRIEWRPAPLEESADGKHPELLTGIAFNLATGKSSVFNANDSGTAALASIEEAAGAKPPEATKNATVSASESAQPITPVFAPYEIPKLQKPKAPTTFVPFSIIEPDTRSLVVHPELAPYRRVVLIMYKKHDSPDQYACSGTIISNNVVLTAGHCIVEEGDMNGWHEQISVYPGRNGAATPYGECHAKALFTLKGWVDGKEVDDPRYYDLAAIKLDCDVGKETGRPAIAYLSDHPADTQITIRGYPCDKPLGRQWQSTGKISEAFRYKVFYDNDTYGCMSGAPVLVDEKLVAVHTNGLHGSEPWASHNAGTRLRPESVRNLELWMEQSP